MTTWVLYIYNIIITYEYTYIPYTYIYTYHLNNLLYSAIYRYYYTFLHPLQVRISRSFPASAKIAAMPFSPTSPSMSPTSPSRNWWGHRPSQSRSWPWLNPIVFKRQKWIKMADGLEIPHGPAKNAKLWSTALRKKSSHGQPWPCSKMFQDVPSLKPPKNHTQMTQPWLKSYVFFPLPAGASHPSSSHHISSIFIPIADKQPVLSPSQSVFSRPSAIGKSPKNRLLEPRMSGAELQKNLRGHHMSSVQWVFSPETGKQWNI